MYAFDFPFHMILNRSLNVDHRIFENQHFLRFFFSFELFTNIVPKVVNCFECGFNFTVCSYNLKKKCQFGKIKLMGEDKPTEQPKLSASVMRLKSVHKNS